MVKRRLIIAFTASILIHIGFLVWSYFVKILPAIPFPDKPEVVFHIKIVKQERIGQEKLRFDSDFSSKSPRPDNPFTQNTVYKPSVESEECDA